MDLNSGDNKRWSGTQRVASWISWIFNPVVMTAASFAMGSFRSALPFTDSLKWFAGAIACSLIMPSMVLLWELRRGTISDWNISDRRQRLRPTFVSSTVAGVAAPMGAIIAFGGPVELLRVYVTGAAANLIHMGITTQWKTSHHVLTVALTTTLMYMFFGMWAAPFLLLIPLTAWARVRLNAHTVPQVIVGATIGASVTILLSFLAGPLL